MDELLVDYETIRKSVLGDDTVLVASVQDLVRNFDGLWLDASLISSGNDRELVAPREYLVMQELFGSGKSIVHSATKDRLLEKISSDALGLKSHKYLRATYESCVVVQRGLSGITPAAITGQQSELGYLVQETLRQLDLVLDLVSTDKDRRSSTLEQFTYATTMALCPPKGKQGIVTKNSDAIKLFDAVFGIATSQYVGQEEKNVVAKLSNPRLAIAAYVDTKDPEYLVVRDTRKKANDLPAEWYKASPKQHEEVMKILQQGLGQIALFVQQNQKQVRPEPKIMNEDKPIPIVKGHLQNPKRKQDEVSVKRYLAPPENEIPVIEPPLPIAEVNAPTETQKPADTTNCKKENAGGETMTQIIPETKLSTDEKKPAYDVNDIRTMYDGLRIVPQKIIDVDVQNGLEARIRAYKILEKQAKAAGADDVATNIENDLAAIKKYVEQRYASAKAEFTAVRGSFEQQKLDIEKRISDANKSIEKFASEEAKYAALLNDTYTPSVEAEATKTPKVEDVTPPKKKYVPDISSKDLCDNARTMYENLTHLCGRKPQDGDVIAKKQLIEAMGIFKTSFSKIVRNAGISEREIPLGKGNRTVTISKKVLEKIGAVLQTPVEKLKR